MQHTVMYFGPMSEKDFSASISKLHKTPKNLLDVPFGMDYMEQPTEETEILLAPYDAKNIYMVQYTNSERDWDASHAPVISLFNEYFGTGMNGIVFQELREARGLAYSAAAVYRQPSRMGHKEDAYTYIATQNDKMMDCVDEFNKLIADIPQSEGAFNLAKESLLKKLASTRTTRFGVLNSYVMAQDRGIDFDINSKIYEALPKMYLFDIVDFGYNADKMSAGYFLFDGLKALAPELFRVSYHAHLFLVGIKGADQLPVGVIGEKKMEDHPFYLTGFFIPEHEAASPVRKLRIFRGKIADLSGH